VGAGGVCGRAGAALLRHHLCGRELDICLYGVLGWEWNIFVWVFVYSVNNFLGIQKARVIIACTRDCTNLRNFATAPAPTRAAAFVMEPAACKHLNDLPDELLQQVMLATNVQAVVACAQACSMWASLVRSEELWEALCVASWPLVHRLPRPAYSSWRLCHRSRCSGTPPGTWRKLIPLYDESALLAIERPGGWIGRLGAVLLRIRSLRKLHGLHNWPRVGARGSRAGVSQACNEEEGLSWLHSVHDALSRPQAAEELLAFAGGASPELPSERVETAEEEVMRRGGICIWLDEWYENNNNNEPALLLRFLAGRSALHAIRAPLQVTRRRFGQASCPFEVIEAFEAALSRYVSK
jgi:hypothetical protein